jgi:hypothetical protein
MSLNTTTVSIALIIDMFAMSFAFGSTVWFFFVQSPAMFKHVVREEFVPLQMRMGKLLFTSALVALALLVAASVVQSGSVTAWGSVAAAAALLFGALNKFFIFPMALRAGGESHQMKEGRGETGSPVEFASEGAGKSATAKHRLVVLFVVAMVAGLVTHGISLLPI